MSETLACALISLAGVIFSGALSLCVSRLTAKYESAMLRLQWQRDNDLSDDREFSEMVGAVVHFTFYPDASNLKIDAITRICSVRSVQSGALAQALDDLSAAVSCADIPSIQCHLESAIYHKREKVRQRHYDPRVQ